MLIQQKVVSLQIIMEDFSSYYPYEGQELKAAIQQLVESQYYLPLAAKLFPEYPPEELKQKILNLADVDQFQSSVMIRACLYIIRNSMADFTYSGLENVGEKPCLFISNHRDITVDAIMTEYILISNQRKSSHVVIGSNLFEMPIMTLMARLNKMYPIGRGGNQKEFYNSLMAMSRYLRHILTERHESAWIAQRNGRTKDGFDRTNPALIKMIAYSGNRHNPAQSLAEMNIVPISISYEWEPCGLLKAREVSLKRQGPYTKAPGEDTQSILSGISDFKGHVHLTFCQPLQMQELEAANGNYDTVAEIIDQRIYQNYHLWPNNYIAHELMTGISHAEHYTDEEKQQFVQYLDKACQQYDIPGYRDTLVGIYGGALH